MNRLNLSSICFVSLKALRRFQQLALLGGCLVTAPLLADPEPQCPSNRLNLEQILQDPNIEVRLEATQQGVVLHLESKVPGSQQVSKNFAIELLKQKNLVQMGTHSNGYGLAEK